MMMKDFDPLKNFKNSKKLVGYVPFKKAQKSMYAKLGFKCGLEIHQQLKTEKKLFCRCPAGLYQKKDEYDGEIIRHMRPTLSELGEYDGTALMEYKTRKTIHYRIKNESACTYDIDDTPPFFVNGQALKYALEIALLLNTSIVGEFHITRKQYLDGSIPTGFQRTGILGINGSIPISNKIVRILQLSLEEDACREVSDVGHDRIFTTDRLGVPLVETVTYPDLHAPEEAYEAAQYLRFLTRSTGKVRTGIGAARQDVNVSIEGGTRVEIKGVAHIKWIPRLTHIEGFRQKALLAIQKTLLKKVSNPDAWELKSVLLSRNHLSRNQIPGIQFGRGKQKLVGVNLPHFQGILSFFTQPNQTFADEISHRLKVIACLTQPNLTHSEAIKPILHSRDWNRLRELLQSGSDDAQLIFWGPEEDLATAVETIAERCRLAFQGVPNETRKALPDGTTVFERVLPGPDRMYPDTDSAPIPIREQMIAKIKERLPVAIADQVGKMKQWGVPDEAFPYIFIRNLFPLIEQIIRDFNYPATFVAEIVSQRMKYIEGHYVPSSPFNFQRIYDLFAFVEHAGLKKEIIKWMLPEVYQYPNMEFESVLTEIGFKKVSKEEILNKIPLLRSSFRKINNCKNPKAEDRWIMGELRPLAVGNVDLGELHTAIVGG